MVHYLFGHFCSTRLAGQAEGGGELERHRGQAEERLGQCAERDHGKGYALFCPQSKLAVI